MEEVNTNNLVESWHNKLKSVYLKSARKQRPDLLVYKLLREALTDLRLKVASAVNGLGTTRMCQTETSKLNKCNAIRLQDVEHYITRLSLSEGSEELEKEILVKSSTNTDFYYTVSLNDGSSISRCTCSYMANNRMVERLLGYTVCYGFSGNRDSLANSQYSDSLILSSTGGFGDHSVAGNLEIAQQITAMVENFENITPEALSILAAFTCFNACYLCKRISNLFDEKMYNKPLILFIDAYDSFSNNIISLLETTLNVSVRTVKIDNPLLLASKSALYDELKNYVAVVCGPGPGSAENEKDVGLMKHIWSLSDERMLPVLGICLGFQSLCFEFGGRIKRLKGPQHGIIRNITHNGSFAGKNSIFNGVGDIYATLYQSLCVDIGHDAMSREELEKKKWQPTDQCPNLLPLAWVEDDLSQPNNSGIKDEKILVGIQHAHHPFWALQYHPESICTNNESRKLIQNWFKHVTSWNQRWERKCVISENLLQGHLATHRPLLDKSMQLESIPHCSAYHIINKNSIPVTRCFTRKIKLPNGVTIPEIVERVQEIKAEHILFESSNTTQSSAVIERFSIIGLDIGKCTRVEYKIGQNSFKVVTPQANSASSTTRVPSEQSFEDVWSYIASQLNMLKDCIGDVESPFWGGFMGYTTYELGLERIGLNSDPRYSKMRSRPDLCFVWVNSSIVVDHANNQIYIQKLAPQADEQNVNHWIENISQKVNSEPVLSLPTRSKNVNGNFLNSQSTLILHPNESDYQSKVLDCQTHIQAGLSYELCLTDQTMIHYQGPEPSWDLYKKLRLSQPAPFASYLRLGSATFISASPEQFLKWDENGVCELRPMKGTVKKSPIVTSLTEAAALLHKPKEKAENLMIVDLARHDLHGICGSGNVTVPRLMVIEEYASVFQMVSQISGKIPSHIKKSNLSALNKNPASSAEIQGHHTGLDVLATSLPPGSMTGAPKKRSCQILQEIEGKERSLYSGVVGYADVRGRGNWSVNIRCLFKWDDEMTVTESGEITWKYHIGAGGAVTTLSTALEEKEEMLAKLEGILRIFKE